MTELVGVSVDIVPNSQHVSGFHLCSSILPAPVIVARFMCEEGRYLGSKVRTRLRPEGVPFKTLGGRVGIVGSSFSFHLLVVINGIGSW